MISMKSSPKVRPSTAFGLLQSKEVGHVLDELRPNTAPGKTQAGFEPTFLTSRHHVPGTLTSSSIKGRQVHGGLPAHDLKGLLGRRATLSELYHDKVKRPLTAAGQKLTQKVIFNYCNKCHHPQFTFANFFSIKYFYGEFIIACV